MAYLAVMKMKMTYQTLYLRMSHQVIMVIISLIEEILITKEEFCFSTQNKHTLINIFLLNINVLFDLRICILLVGFVFVFVFVLYYMFYDRLDTKYSKYNQ